MKVLTAAGDVTLAALAVVAACSLAWVSASFGATPPRAPLAVSAVVTAPLYPGHSVRVRVRLTNATGHRFKASPGTIRVRVSNLPRGCRASWFRFSSHAGGTLTFVNAPTDQSACAGAAPRLSLSIR
jgi:uncharacterized protein (DUF58 family)